MMSKPNVWPETRGLRILGITYGFGSNNGDLIFNPEFFEPGEIQSQITNWCEIEFVAYGPHHQCLLSLLGRPCLAIRDPGQPLT